MQNSMKNPLNLFSERIEQEFEFGDEAGLRWFRWILKLLGL
jgi:hypothetical protein